MRHVVVLALLVSASLGAVAVVEGQTDREPLFEMLDPAGDLRPATLVTGTLPTPGAPASVATDVVDLRALRILDEDYEGIEMEVVVNDMRGAAQAAHATDHFTYQILFRLEASPVAYQVGWSLNGLILAQLALGVISDATISPSMCLREADQPSACFVQPVSGRLDFENSRFVLTVPKSSLIGSHPSPSSIFGPQEPPPGTPTRLPMGSVISEWQVASQYRSWLPYANIATFVVYLQDDMPDAGEPLPSYAMRYGTANTVIAVRGPEAAQGGTASPQVAIVAGAPVPVPIIIQNMADGKRLLELEVEVPPQSGVAAHIAPHIEVPSEESRTVTLTVTASAAAQHLQVVDIKVVARSIGYEDEVGFERLATVVTVPPGPDNPTLRFHASTTPPPGTNECRGGVCTSAVTWLNTLQVDPRADADDAFPAPLALSLIVGGQYTVFNRLFPMDTPLPLPVAFDAEALATAELAFSANTQFDAAFQVSLMLEEMAPCTPGSSFQCVSRQIIGSGVTRGTVATSPSTHTVSFLINPEYERIAPESGRLGILVMAHTDDPRASAGNAPLQAVFHPGRSSVTLPFVEDVDGPGSGSLLVGLYASSDTEEYVNPGRTAVFHLMLVNEAASIELLGLNAAVDKEGWTASVRPADKFRLGSGDGVRVAVFVSAPADAAEGEIVRVTANAHNLNQTDIQRNLTLRAIATQGIEIPDKAQGYADDEETLARVYDDRPVKESPGPAVIPFLAAGAAFAAWIRRRRMP